MNRYLALIRGINVGGKSRVSMSELKVELEKATFSDVFTYINSGNILFSSTEADLVKLVSKFERILKKHFDVETYVSVVSVDEFRKAVDHAPAWWGKNTATVHNNAMVVIAPASADEIIKDVGEPRSEYEKVDSYGHLIFWSAPLTTYGRTKWSKIVGTPSYKKVTIRNSNTIRKLYDLAG
ncbi:MAG: DUF1697 domain-containing protein [Candidatus Saccharibacteria bacterium]